MSSDHRFPGVEELDTDDNVIHARGHPETFRFQGEAPKDMFSG